MQTQQYTLTNRIMGDPRPDRFAASEHLRSKVRFAPAKPDSIHRDNRVTAAQRLHRCLAAVRDGYSTVQAISDKIGMSYRAVGNHMTRARESEWVEATILNPVNGTGRVYAYTITPAGTAELERVK